MKDMPADDTKDQARPDPTKSSADPAPGGEAPAGRKTLLSEDTGVHRATPVRPASGAGFREGVGASADRAVSGTAVRGRPDAHDARLLPQDECDKYELRMRHAVGGFVDGPRDSVEEADQVLEELAARFADAVARRRTKLRTSWHETGADTEQLRIALRDYREVTERLLRF
ncbi:hypothetical protein [Streptomyces sp. NBC_00038]|uniref:hypothetical protein n=1 Tax=Streptomyces sp. NBC_00038 TaxID=2903615 RepID=UPI00224CEE86|nr:hypothetical protein [Streptomyces sp. NBC_00038]MCX5557317.1 hypothetical protein [Streptomyces sp. NBC_00038]